MAITLRSDYSKKLGLPGFSSHQFSVSIETELTDLERVPGEVARLYQLLQQAVDREIQQTGFVPGEDYGLAHSAPANCIGPSNGNGDGSRPASRPFGGNGSGSATWQCSDKQSKLIADLAKQNELTDDQLDERSHRLFGKPARQLNKLSASGLITALIEEAAASGKRNGNGNRDNSTTTNGGRR